MLLERWNCGSRGRLAEDDFFADMVMQETLKQRDLGWKPLPQDERDEVQFGGFHSPRESTAFMDLLHLLYKQSPHKSEDMFLYRNVESVSPIGVVVAKLWLLGDCSFGPLICSHISHFSGGSSSSRSFSILAHLSLGISHTFSHLLSSSHISALLLFSPVLNSSRLFSEVRSWWSCEVEVMWDWDRLSELSKCEADVMQGWGYARWSQCEAEVELMQLMWGSGNVRLRSS